MSQHTRKSDTEMLIQFAKDQGFDHSELMEAVERLEQCHKEELQDYGCAIKLISVKSTAKTNTWNPEESKS